MIRGITNQKGFKSIPDRRMLLLSDQTWEHPIMASNQASSSDAILGAILCPTNQLETVKLNLELELANQVNDRRCPNRENRSRDGIVIWDQNQSSLMMDRRSMFTMLSRPAPLQFKIINFIPDMIKAAISLTNQFKPINNRQITPASSKQNQQQQAASNCRSHRHDERLNEASRSRPEWVVLHHKHLAKTTGNCVEYRPNQFSTLPRNNYHVRNQ